MGFLLFVLMDIILPPLALSVQRRAVRFLLYIGLRTADIKTHLKETDGSLPGVAGQYKAWKADFDCVKAAFVSPGDLNPVVCDIITRHHTGAAVQF